MAQIVVDNLDPLLIAQLTSRSQRHHRSLNDELLDILVDAVRAEDVDKEASTLEAEEKLVPARARYTGRIFNDSSRLVRENRER